VLFDNMLESGKKDNRTTSQWNVAIGCQGRFHLFDLARQMERLCHLSNLYTGYPRFKVEALPRKKVSTFPWLMGPYMAAGRFNLQGCLEGYERLILRSFDEWVSRKIAPCDVYHCLSAAGVRTHSVVRKRYGAVSICDRPCSHILYQERITGEEYALQGLSFRGVDKYIKERELQEYELCDRIVVPSTFAFQSFIELGVPPTRIRKNPLGVDLRVYNPVPKKDNIFRVIYTGAISIRKGIRYLLEALSELRLPDFEIWLIGYARPDIAGTLARYEGKFNYIGPIDRRLLHRFYSQGSVFVFPSVDDGFGLVQAEAMACGLPVIATWNTGAPDLFTDGVEGFIVPIREPQMIREKVLLLYNNPDLRHEMSKAALRRVKAIGGWNDYGERAVQIYDEALAGGSKPRNATSARE
jgi:starch synthase